MCLVLHAINMKGLFFLCVVLFISCTFKPSGTEGTDSLSKNRTESVKNDSVKDNMLETYINSLDIRMELEDSIFSIYPDTLHMNIINNSDYKLLTGSRYSMKYFESGIWKSISQLENTIWADVEIPVDPQSSRGSDAILFIRNLKPGRYRIEKEFSIVIPTIKRSPNNIRITLSDEFILN